eukprot:gene9358-9521_t
MNDQLMRFCQQCGIMHPLADFDGTRKSCRVQLDRHNLRRRCRRKTQGYHPGGMAALGGQEQYDPAAVRSSYGRQQKGLGGGGMGHLGWEQQLPGVAGGLEAPGGLHRADNRFDNCSSGMAAGMTPLPMMMMAYDAHVGSSGGLKSHQVPRLGVQQLRLHVASAIAGGCGPGLSALRGLGFVQQLLVVDELATGLIAELEKGGQLDLAQDAAGELMLSPNQAATAAVVAANKAAAPPPPAPAPAPAAASAQQLLTNLQQLLTRSGHNVVLRYMAGGQGLEAAALPQQHDSGARYGGSDEAAAATGCQPAGADLEQLAAPYSGGHVPAAVPGSGGVAAPGGLRDGAALAAALLQQQKAGLPKTNDAAAAGGGGFGSVPAAYQDSLSSPAAAATNSNSMSNRHCTQGSRVAPGGGASPAVMQAMPGPRGGGLGTPAGAAGGSTLLQQLRSANSRGGGAGSAVVTFGGGSLGGDGGGGGGNDAERTAMMLTSLLQQLASASGK